MKHFTVEMRCFKTNDDIHTGLKKVFDFPDYYGANLDALHDELTSITENVEVKLILADDQPLYFNKIIHVFEDSARENHHLKVEIKN
ncbi:MAG: barstar family protein [Eubacterium sp.]